jgi:GNAT superfamily N-acetyltransferase
MGIRVATLDDLELLIKMGKKFIATTFQSKYADDDYIRSYAIDFLSNPDPMKRIALMYDDVGVLGGTVTPFPWGPMFMAHDVLWWVEPDERGKKAGIELFNGFEYWAKSVGCNQIVMVGIEDRTCKFYEKNGYTLQERGYVKDI